MKWKGMILASSALMIGAVVAYRHCPPAPTFKNAVAVELYDCAPADHECPGPGTMHFSIDPGKFREAVASATYDASFLRLSKGAFLVKVTLPDGSVRNIKVFYGGEILQQLDEHGYWSFAKDSAFPKFLKELHQGIVIPARINRNTGTQPVDGGGLDTDAEFPAQQGIAPDGRSPATLGRTPQEDRRPTGR